MPAAKRAGRPKGRPAVYFVHALVEGMQKTPSRG